jgi:hypothetical protein
MQFSFTVAGKDLQKITEEQLMAMPKVMTFLSEQRKKQNNLKISSRKEERHI